jgi:hypothetical protein
MRKIKWLVVYPVGLVLYALIPGRSWGHLVTVMLLATAFLLLFDLPRLRRRSMGRSPGSPKRATGATSRSGVALPPAGGGTPGSPSAR